MAGSGPEATLCELMETSAVEGKADVISAKPDISLLRADKLLVVVVPEALEAQRRPNSRSTSASFGSTRGRPAVVALAGTGGWFISPG